MTDVSSTDPVLKVFISYSWDNDSHCDWVLELANRLESNGLHVILDKFELRVGKTLTHFMEKSIVDADKVLIIMTPDYKKKADDRISGVGYEYSMVTQELYAEQESEKFLPVLRTGSNKDSAPKFLSTFISHNMTDDMTFERDFTGLLRIIYGEPEVKRPPRGKKPSFANKTIPTVNTTLIDDKNNLKLCGMATSAKWVIDIRLTSLQDQDKVKLFKLLKSNQLVDDEYKNTLPFILMDSHKLSHHPAIIYEMPLKSYMGISNQFINEKLEIKEGLIHYEFSEYCNHEFWLLNTVQPFTTLFYLLAILKKTHKHLNRDVEIKLEINFETDRNAHLYPKYAIFEYDYSHATYLVPGSKGEISHDLLEINNDSVFDFYENLYSLFVSENPKATEPYPKLKRGAFDAAVKDFLTEI